MIIPRHTTQDGDNIIVVVLMTRAGQEHVQVTGNGFHSRRLGELFTDVMLLGFDLEPLSGSLACFLVCRRTRDLLKYP